MQTIKQVFKLRTDTSEYNRMFAEAEDMMFTRKEGIAYGKKMYKLQDKIERDKANVSKSIVADGLHLAQFVYNYNARTARFGLRGQDIQDQLQLQDKMVNKAFGITGVAVASGFNPVAIAGAVFGAVLSEALTLSIQNRAYEYRREIDAEQKDILRERVGREVYNSSRR